MKIPKRLRPYVPNTSDKLALVSLDDKFKYRAHWPLRLTQIIGGKTWSLSFVRHPSQKPEINPDYVRLAHMVAYMDLHIGRYEMSQLTTEQKNLWADLVDFSGEHAAVHEGGDVPARKCVRWWDE